MNDVDECASSPCAAVTHSVGCWQGIDEWACKCPTGSNTRFDQTGNRDGYDDFTPCSPSENTCDQVNAFCTHTGGTPPRVCTCKDGFVSQDGGEHCRDDPGH